MLVLTRRVSERIVIGTGPGAITIEVVEIDRARVHLGIMAPKDVPVNREEIHRQIHGETAQHAPDSDARREESAPERERVTRQLTSTADGAVLPQILLDSCRGTTAVDYGADVVKCLNCRCS